MENLVEKISSYNIFNYLFPGIIFSITSGDSVLASISQKDVFSYFFICYFIGLIISRFGSLIIEPILKKFSFIKFSPYLDFLSASKKDPKLEILSQENNTYRTLSSLLFLLLIFRIYMLVESIFPGMKSFSFYIISLLLLILFLFSYKKNTDFIVKRVEACKKQK